jgi:CheY-like chemotaxis protein
MAPDSQRLLVIEDNNADIFLIKLALQENKIPAELTVCTDGDAAIRLLHSPDMDNPPDAIIVDLSLPRIDGLDIVRKTLSLPQFTNIPIMIFTSSASPSDKERVEKLITNSRYVQKPIGLDDFTREVAENVRSMLSSKNK